MRQKKFILQESELPTQWYNIQADMPNKPLPPLNPQTHQPLNADDLSHIFNKECSKQELDQEHAWIDIPEDVLEKYTFYRSTPLVRAYALEEALGTPAHIYFKNESTNPLGSHKINSALPQCYYCKQEGDTNVTTETGAGQWGAALSYAAKLYGLEAAVYQVKITMQQKPYRSSIMRTFGATVEGSPSMSTRAGKNIITRAIGTSEEIKIDFFDVKLEKNSIFMMCSDGLYNSLSNEQMIKILAGEGNAKVKTEELIKQANIHGGYDNISVILLEGGEAHE